MPVIPSTYAIHVYDDEANTLIAEPFEGADAFSRASDFLEQVKQLPEAHDIWFIRLDGGSPTRAGKRLKRDDQGKWLEVDG
jgi:hypothetical protein